MLQEELGERVPISFDFDVAVCMDGSDNDVKVQEYFDAMVHGKEHKEKE